MINRIAVSKNYRQSRTSPISITSWTLSIKSALSDFIDKYPLLLLAMFTVILMIGLI